MKISLCRWLVLTIFLLSISAGCSGNVETAGVQVTQLLRADRQERFFNSAPQQNYEISWSVFSRADIDGNSEIDYPVISAVYPVGRSEIAQEINDAMWLFLKMLTEPYAGIWAVSFGHLTHEVMRFDEELFSIKYQGEISNSAGGEDHAFALNFCMRTGELLALDDLFDRESVLSALGNGMFSPLFDEEADHPINLEMRFRDSRFLHMDKNRNHDFYFDNDTLFLIINPFTALNYTIYEINLHS